MTIEKKQETNGITINCFFVWLFMVHSMICMSDQPGSTRSQILRVRFCFGELIFSPILEIGTTLIVSLRCNSTIFVNDK